MSTARSSQYGVVSLTETTLDKDPLDPLGQRLPDRDPLDRDPLDRDPSQKEQGTRQPDRK